MPQREDVRGGDLEQGSGWAKGMGEFSKLLPTLYTCGLLFLIRL